MIEHPYPAWFVWAATSFLVLHGLVHLIGVWAGFGWSEVDGLMGAISPAEGAAWLMAASLFVIGGVMYAASSSYWWMVTAAGIAISQPLIVMHWQDAWAGTIPNMVLFGACILGFAAWQFGNQVDQQLENLRTTDVTSETTISASQLDGLPHPVRTWLESSGVVGQQRPAELRLHQTGRMRTEPSGDWMSVQANQYIRIDQPGYVWGASVRAGPLIYLSGRDTYIDGEGRMLIKLLSLVPVVDSTGAEIDQGSLVRYLAEMVWYPSAALEEYITWRAVDETTARAEMDYKDVSADATFEFTPEGKIRRITADRYYDRPQGATMETWVITIPPDSYEAIDGIRVPTEASVTWELDKPFTWYELTVTELRRDDTSH
jgi:hypothetical protein